MLKGILEISLTFIVIFTRTCGNFDVINSNITAVSIASNGLKHQLKWTNYQIIKLSNYQPSSSLFLLLFLSFYLHLLHPSIIFSIHQFNNSLLHSFIHCSFTLYRHKITWYLVSLLMVTSSSNHSFPWEPTLLQIASNSFFSFIL